MGVLGYLMGVLGYLMGVLGYLMAPKTRANTLETYGKRNTDQCGSLVYLAKVI